MFMSRARRIRKPAQPTNPANVKKLIEGFDGLGRVKVLAQAGLFVLLGDLEEMTAGKFEVSTTRIFKIDAKDFWTAEGYIGDLVLTLQRGTNEAQFIKAAKAALTVFSKE